ncbi:MAG: hypothetical protein JWQ07_3099 [Ramlibacter sp.]|nr:hypothetical protein [Ramlibacter sp.]
MDYDESKVDQAALALLYLTLHDHNHSWKSIDWDTMNRLYEKGLIANPMNKAKSVVFSELGLLEAKRLFAELFGKGAT